MHKKYKDFASLNSLLKKLLSPAILPKFPAKTYVQNLRKADSQGLEIRRRKLEKFMAHVLNDPSFQCQELLDFIEYKQPVFTIWEKICDVEYELTNSVG